MSDDLLGMTERGAAATSVKAAKEVAPKRPTYRSRVLAFAEAKPEGFIDHDLREIDPDAPESSLRKRRTELTDDGLIVATNSERLNRNGQPATVYVHRKFHPAPPPIVEAKGSGKNSAALRKRKQHDLMFNALIAAAPHHQGAHSEVGRKIADALGIPFPIRPNDLPAIRPL